MIMHILILAAGQPYADAGPSGPPPLITIVGVVVLIWIISKFRRG